MNFWPREHRWAPSGDCERILLSHVKWAKDPVDIVYSLDRATGIPLSVSCHTTQDSPVPDRKLWTWEADTFDEVGAHRFPLKSTEVTFVRDVSGGAASPAILSTRKLIVEEITFDKEFAKSTFKPVPTPGTTVWDQVAKKTYVVPGGAQKGESSTSARSVASGGLVGRQWSYYIPFGVILSLSLVAVAAIQWRKSRRSK
jgi:hypothetical protein